MSAKGSGSESATTQKRSSPACTASSAPARLTPARTLRFFLDHMALAFMDNLRPSTFAGRISERDRLASVLRTNGYDYLLHKQEQASIGKADSRLRVQARQVELTRISDLDLWLAHRTLSLPSTQRICQQSGLLEEPH